MQLFGQINTWRHSGRGCRRVMEFSESRLSKILVKPNLPRTAPVCALSTSPAERLHSIVGLKSVRAELDRKG